MIDVSDTIIPCQDKVDILDKTIDQKGQFDEHVYWLC